MSTEFDAIKCVPSPIGPITLAVKSNCLVSVQLGIKRKDYGHSPVLEQAKKQLAEYFLGTRKSFELATQTSGTKFQKAVWQQLAKLKSGQSISYGEIARRIGAPAASRAVGAAVGANPIPLVVGCHRVLGASGKLTGFTGGRGIPTKIFLLRHEGIEYRD
jgi:methylated-DNA-[protein]-cysteine S-methyltransferase